MSRMYLVQEHLWPGLAYEYRARQSAGWHQFLAGEHQVAAALFRDAYQLLLESQPEERRYHKGEALHNWGLALLWSGEVEAGLRETLAAFIEDAASLAEENPVFEELGRPAAHNLVYAFGVSGPALAAFGLTVRAHITAGSPLPDPHVLLVTPAAEALIAARTATAPTSLIERLRASVQRAVFVGGGYAHIDTHVRPMRDVVNKLGYDGVVVADTEAPPDWRSDHWSITLLYFCTFVIIDGSDPAGQQVEVHRLVDRQLRPDRTLILFDTALADRVQLSGGMNMEMLEAYGIHAHPYLGIEDAAQIIRRWLPDLAAP
jgi:hypothetical protein